MIKFKPGDKVKVIRDPVERTTYDEVGEICKATDHGCSVHIYGNTMFFWADEVVPVDDETDYTPKDIKEVDHYRESDIECVDYLWDNMPMEAFIGGLEWNVKKYLHRWRRKSAPVKDLRKARDYLTVLIDVMEGKEPKFKEWDK